MEKFRHRLKRHYTSKVWLGTEESEMITRISIFGMFGIILMAIISIALNAGWLFFAFTIPIIIFVASMRIVTWVRWLGTRGRYNWRYWSGEYYEPLEEGEESQEI